MEVLVLYKVRTFLRVSYKITYSTWVVGWLLYFGLSMLATRTSEEGLKEGRARGISNGDGLKSLKRIQTIGIYISI